MPEEMSSYPPLSNNQLHLPKESTSFTRPEICLNSGIDASPINSKSYNQLNSQSLTYETLRSSNVRSSLSHPCNSNWNFLLIRTTNTIADDVYMMASF